MSETSVEGRLLKALVRAVLDEDFTPKEARAAAKALRDNKMFSPVAHFLDVLGAAVNVNDITAPKPVKSLPTKDQRSSIGNLSVDGVFDIVKRRKITKGQLFDMFNALDSEATPDLPDQLSMREALAAFKAVVSDDDWRTLIKIIEGRVELDPFLRGILRQ